MRVCIFCEDTASTKEDAWPRWLLRRIGAAGPGEIDSDRGGAGSRSWHLAHAALPIRCVCSSCNSGWMSQLETQAEPVIDPLLGDAQVTLSASQQRTLAVWSVKCAMVYEGLRANQPWAFMQEERTRLRESLDLPPRARVWIAKCVNPPGPYCSARDLSGYAEGLKLDVSAYVTTMAFGPLALQVMNFRLPGTIPTEATVSADLVDGPWDSLALQIWPDPCPQLTWPAERGLVGEEGLDAFGQRWKVG